MKEKENVCVSKLTIEELTIEQCRTLFWFEKYALSFLHNALGLREKIVCQNCTICTGNEGLCTVLRRLAYPIRLEDLQHLFGRSKKLK